METWIALFRGINVGGNHLLSMSQLKSDLESLKLKNVRTYIQSGNVVFESATRTPASLARQMSTLIERQHGFRPQVLILARDELLRAVELNPFPQAVSDPKSLHFFFLAETPTDPDINALDAAKSPTESYKLCDRILYLHAPDGVGRSKLAAHAEKYLRVVSTARNYRTVDKLVSMVNCG